MSTISSIAPTTADLRCASPNSASALGPAIIREPAAGIAEPSQADELVTRRLAEALQLIDVRVLDHIGDAAEYSFA